MGEVKGYIKILRPREMQLYVVVKFRREFGVTPLVGIGVNIGNEGVHHPVVGSLDASGVTGTDADGLL